MRAVLIERLATARCGHPVYFSAMSVVGPQLTSTFSEAYQFIDKSEAFSSPAYSFWLTDFDAVNAEDEDAVWDLLTEPVREHEQCRRQVEEVPP